MLIFKIHKNSKFNEVNLSKILHEYLQNYVILHKFKRKQEISSNQEQPKIENLHHR